MPSNSKPPSSTKTSTVSTSWSSLAAAPIIKATPTAAVKAAQSKSTLSPVTSIKPQPKPGTPAQPPTKTSPTTDHHDSPKNETTHIHVLKPIHFDVKCTGMKPLTVHKFYYEGVDVSEFCTLITSVDSVLPATTGLITDKNGNIEFKFNFKADLLSTVVGLDKTKHILAGDKKFELLATGSSAAKIVPYKN